MPMSAISAVSAAGVQLPHGAVTGSTYIPGVAGIGSVGTSQVPTAQGTAFGEILTGAVTGLQSRQDRSSNLAVRAVTGDLDDVHDYTVAASEAKVALELTVAVRNKAVEAFNEVMRMQA
ncbi:flagellar hook-basal body complex protein FliE [Jonesiaceae bacterium BS-20]|uniref:Flagellar hook-basal body complex protein FliE n=1 Tax=Jonesiaceae bacterium BS-20 TaxID=3120821 RepID=A0AAU7DWB5_9MICO